MVSQGGRIWKLKGGKNKYILDREAGGIKVWKKKGDKNLCTCSSQLCCAYSESLLHPERLLSVSFGKQGFIAKEGAAAGVRAHMWMWGVSERKVGVCGSLLWRRTWLPTWASIITHTFFDPTHYMAWRGSTFLSYWEESFTIFLWMMSQVCSHVEYKCVLCVNKLESWVLDHWRGKC